ncbi:ATP-binding cassette domain-containing protein [Paenibacillus sp. MMS18-CY102]|uniref:ATP-binding cassette domain-containing protein n=1 Tax=Paenibacillus sp. MMS18-CY102 TaxID=2682849 RepID=UPI00136571D1|nr:ABC transporter ATP-binding protein [Paenibacillus sp. MMS18-CY102]
MLTWWQFGLTRRIVDSLAATADWKPIITLALLLGLVQVFNFAFIHLERWSNDTIGLNIDRAVARHVYTQISIHTITRLETPEYANDLHLLKMSLNNVRFMVGAVIRIVRQLVLIASYMNIIAHYNSWLLLVLLAFSIPGFVFEQKYANRMENSQQQRAQHELSVWHMADILTNSRNSREMLIFGIRPFLLRKWEAAISNVHMHFRQLHRIELTWRLLYGLSTPLCLITTQCLMIYLVSQHKLTIGDYIALTAAISSAEGTLSVIANNTLIMKQVLLFAGRLTRFLNRYASATTEETASPKVKQEIQIIAARKLSFKYPNSERLILDKIDLALERGKVLALVGENGSGKSTLASVLFGLHEIDSGMLYMNENDLNDVDRSEWFKQFSVVQQDYIRYPMSLLENITLAENAPASRQQLEWVQREYPYLIPDHLHNNPDVLLGNNLIGSVQLSGGQWQRIAAARAIVKSAPFLLLDEATSEMDPETSAQFLHKLLDERKGLTTVIVTHLMPIAAMADEIIVMHEGKIAEQGDYETLLKQRGKFSEMCLKHQINETKEEASNEYELQSFV